MSLRSVLLALLVASTALAVITPSAAAEDPVPPVCDPSTAPTALPIGVPIQGQDNVAGALPASDCWFSVSIPAGSDGKNLRLLINSTANHDVLVARGGPSQAGQYACFGINSGATSDACTVGWPLTQPVYSVRVYRAAGTDPASPFTVTAFLDTVSASGCQIGASTTDTFAVTPLAEGVAQALKIGLPTGSRCYFSFDPNSAADLAKLVLVPTGTTTLPTSVRLYLRQGDVPVPSVSALSGASADYGCVLAPLAATASETCTGIIPTVAPSPPLASATTWYGMVIRSAAATAVQGASITGSGVTSCSLGAGPHDLSGSVSATLSADAGAHCLFRAPISQVESLSQWSLTPTGTANSDLAIRKGVSPVIVVPAASPAVASAFDCAAAASAATTADVCAVAVAGVSDVYAKVWRSSATGTGAFTLGVAPLEGCSVSSAPASGVTELADNVAVPVALASANEAYCRFHFVPNPLEATVRVSDAITSAAPAATTVAQTIGETLYVKRGAPASPTSFDCSAVASVSVSTIATGGVVTTLNGLCDLQNLGDEIHVLVKRNSGAPASILAARAFSPCSFDDASAGGSTHDLVDGVAVGGGLLDDAGGACQLKFTVPASADAALIGLAPNPGADYDLYVKLGSAPTPSSYDCRSSSNVTGAAESCLAVLGAGTYYATVRRAAGSGPWSVTASSLSSCSLGVVPSTLSKGVSATGSLIDAAGAKCYFTFTPGHPLADPAHPADDVVKLALSSDAANNFDLYVRKAAVPSTATKDCQSVQAAGSVDACELVVADGSTYYGMVRRVAGSGPFTVTATTSSSCLLGPGYHALPNGLEVKASTRQLAGSKCFFSLPSGAKDDLLSVAQSADPYPGLTSFTLTLAKDHPASVSPSDCSGTSFYFASSGIVLPQAAQCDLLLEDGLPHTWYASVARTSGTQPEGAAFTIKGSSITIPTLVAGVPQTGHVDTGTVQYWKVVLPQNATFLDIQTAGDVSSLGCGMGASLNSNIALACALLPFPKLVGCAVVAGYGAPYGVDCTATQQTLLQRCVAQTGDPVNCAAVEAARLEACAALNEAQPDTCDPAATSGTVNGACGIVNGQTGDATCDPDNASVKTTEIDLLVRHRLGLPTTAKNDCRSATAGTTERCLFSADVKAAHDNVTEPARGDLNEQLANLTKAINGNRTALDQAIADLKEAIAENRTGLLEPLWALIRELILTLTGQDAGALPGTPGVPAAPGTPGAVVPDQTSAKALPGPGKYFIAVRGPLDLASALYYQGGDYAIVALHDDVHMPTQQDLDDQLASLLTSLDAGLVDRCLASSPAPEVCSTAGGLLSTACGEIPVFTPEGCAHLDGSLSGSCWLLASGYGEDLCPALDPGSALLEACGDYGVVFSDEGCTYLDGSPEGACWFIDEASGEDLCLAVPPVPGLPEAPSAPDPEDGPEGLVEWLLESLGF